MIVWINGAFGVGKTTTARLLTESLPDARLFDPEFLGTMLTAFVTPPTGDFQDLPLWRHLVVQTVTGLDRHHAGVWIVPMSLLLPAYRAEILGGIRACGIDVREVVLTLPEDRLRARIDADQIEAGARGWRHDHVARALDTFASVTDAHLIDATVPPEQVADAVAAHVTGDPEA
ncbi:MULTISPECIES: AAA family ATPase [Micromonospora]|uniref:AAA family ATPase n=1 Tax=Micromonospora TaxID=1873 RepID=UPI0021C7E00D|nr:AAA family ATPase [Micromonospora sp. Mcm103]